MSAPFTGLRFVATHGLKPLAEKARKRACFVHIVNCEKNPA